MLKDGKDGRPPLSFGHFPRERGKPSLSAPLDSRLRGNDD